jgi:aspartyl-tRNA(Asn)/glutamyl-tRNA(Gln) amidotransferase subunit A
MCGPDPDRDSTSLDRCREDFSSLNSTVTGSKKGCASVCHREFFGDGLAPDVRAAVEAAWPSTKTGGTLVEISLPRTELSIPVYYIIAPAEASSNLSRFDGVKFGHRAANTPIWPTCTARRAPKASATRSSAAS